MTKTVAFLGIGNRGYIYAKFAKERNIPITAICDSDENSLKITGDSLGVAEERRFHSAEDFFAQGNLADVLFISTPDTVHAQQCVSALKNGYDVVLEKPIAISLAQLREIERVAKTTGRKIVVCHVLRYTDFYRKIKEIVTSGTIGDVVHMSQSENVGWWHYTQSFTRGKWRNLQTSSPMILAKCCHDFDIVNWILEDRCVRLSSFGSLSHFNRRNAPKGSSDSCFECDCRADCLYNCIDRSIEMPGTMNVPYGFGFTEKEIREYLSDRDNEYGRCVYKSDNDVVDHQTVAMEFESGITATLNMHAFAQSTYRHTKITGTKGEIDSVFSDEGESRIKVSVFRPFDRFREDMIRFEKKDSGHGGGDSNFFESAIGYLFHGTVSPDISELNVSLASHYMAFAAEESRISGGEVQIL